MSSCVFRERNSSSNLWFGVERFNYLRDLENRQSLEQRGGTVDSFSHSFDKNIPNFNSTSFYFFFIQPSFREWNLISQILFSEINAGRLKSAKTKRGETGDERGDIKLDLILS